MNCPSERALDRAAAEMLDRGIEPGASRSAIGRHARECVRCGEILALLLDAERTHRVRLEQAVEAGTGSFPIGGAPETGRQILPLRPVAAGRRAFAGEEVAGAADDPGYAVAADTPDARGAEQRLQASRVLTLTTENNQFLVRIFPDESGEGAYAVLLPSQTPGTGTQHQPGRSVPRVFLRVGDIDSPFDERGTARLAAFPSEPVSVILRS